MFIQLYCLLSACIVLHADLRSSQTAASTPDSEMAGSFRTVPNLSQITIQCDNIRWLDTFHVPWNKMRPSLKRAMDAGERPKSEDRRHMVKVILDSMREHSLNPTRKDCTVVAKYITDGFPLSFLDKTEEGETIGCGYFS